MERRQPITMRGRLLLCFFRFEVKDQKRIPLKTTRRERDLFYLQVKLRSAGSTGGNLHR